MIHQLNYSDWQEWTIRVGCLFIVIGIHLWLLFFNAVELFSWQSASINGAAAPTLSLSFSTSSSTTPIVQETVSTAVNKNVVLAEVSGKVSTKLSARKVEKIEKNKLEAQAKTELNDVSNVNSANVEALAGEKKYDKEIVAAPLTASPQEEFSKNESNAHNSARVVVYQPKLIAPPIPPVYPGIARRKKQQGTVWLDIFLDKNGYQSALKIHKSSGVEVLDKAAVDAVEQWQFASIQEDYQASNVKIRIPIEFLLK